MACGVDMDNVGDPASIRGFMENWSQISEPCTRLIHIHAMLMTSEYRVSQTKQNIMSWNRVIDMGMQSSDTMAHVYLNVSFSVYTNQTDSVGQSALQKSLRQIYLPQYPVLEAVAVMELYIICIY